MTAAPETGLTEREIIERAAALRPALLARQAETERLTHYPEDTHDDFLRAGFYRILQPRRYGGNEFGLPVFYRVIVEIARGCPSTGWALSLTAAHVLQACTVFDERPRTNSSAPTATSGPPPPSRRWASHSPTAPTT
ncbi:acyl-CoA dehydrogenase family protein [Streptomyces canus]|uniref:acyl-CoA dehydrogenase family protein n=1 Tax=Streptomyces canus TaxID=58343 RepID=UPI0037135CDB